MDYITVYQIPDINCQATKQYCNRLGLWTQIKFDASHFNCDINCSNDGSTATNNKLSGRFDTAFSTDFESNCHLHSPADWPQNFFCPFPLNICQQHWKEQVRMQDKINETPEQLGLYCKTDEN